jgi:branched-subunit amino acid aminotransferase/4-amino-4-deoxychorismate lyase
MVSSLRSELNGGEVALDDLRMLALMNYGHFTSMQVLDGCVRGLDLHLQRLDRSTRELFGHPLDIDATRGHMRKVIAASTGPMSLRVNVFSRRLDRDRLANPVEVDVLVTGAPAREIATVPLRVRSVRYERESPHIKHVGTFGLFQQKRLAQAAGYDDALFVDASGAVSEGSIWNVGFFDGERVLWPDAPALDGTSMQLLKAGLRASAIPMQTGRIELGEIASFRGAFFTNSSCAACPIAAIDSNEFVVDKVLLDTLEACMALAPWQHV